MVVSRFTSVQTDVAQEFLVRHAAFSHFIAVAGFSDLLSIV